MEEIDTLIAARATVASPAFTGNPTAPTQAVGDSSTKIATTAFVETAVGGAMPSGALLPYAGSTAPTGFLMADGSAVSRSANAALFAAIGTAYGAGDGLTTFNLPNLQGRIPVGKNAGTFSMLGGTGGEETHTLSAAEMPVHSHGASSSFSGNALPGHAHGTAADQGGWNFRLGTNFSRSGTGAGISNLGGVGGGTDTTEWMGTTTDSAGTPSGSVSTSIGNAGSGGSHNNLQPYQVVNYIIKT